MSQIDHLRSFLAAYRTGSVSHAATQLGLTQPAVSGHIKSLEAALEKPLFERKARGVAPTAAAHALAKEIAASLDHVEQALAKLRARSTTISGTIHIAGPAEFLTEWLAERLSAVIENGLAMRFHTGNRDQIYALLENGTADLAITASTPEGRQLGYAELHRERLLLVAAPAFAARLAGRTVDAALLSSLSAIAYDEEMPLIRQYGRSVFREELSPRLTSVAPDLRLVRRLVANGHGWSVLPDYLCAEKLRSGALVQMGAADAGPENPLYLVWPKANLRHPRVAAAKNALLDAISSTAN
jgi:DNA-binding transcriptional LysR family regulator